MNFQSGKFYRLVRGKLAALPRLQVSNRQIHEVLNSSRREFSALKILNVRKLSILCSAKQRVFLGHRQTGNCP
ncbi:hypothetical protein, partial [Paracoccus liaowanqingii]|uniref:hypothetical protein n=1 Tax=Paracoccus liaowanqingii TaxID=2560053 RepID=UPI0019807B1C